MTHHKFDVKKLEKLNNPERIKNINLDKIINTLDLPANSTLVDIGVGTGIFSEKFLELLPSSKCIGCDISLEMIDWIKENRLPNLSSRFEIKLMNETAIPLEDGVADLGFMIMLHHELENPIELLKDVHRILKPSGKILICDWKEGMHRHFVTKESILSDLDSSGFSKIQELDVADNLVCFIANKY